MEQYRELQSLAPSVHVVAGDYDDYSDNSTATLRNLPEHVIVKVGAFTIGLIHGHQLVPWNSPEALERMQRKLQVDILITGHSHQNNITILPNQKVLLNPVRQSTIVKTNSNARKISKRLPRSVFESHRVPCFILFLYFWLVGFYYRCLFSIGATRQQGGNTQFCVVGGTRYQGGMLCV